jgi:hypothetical protein
MFDVEQCGSSEAASLLADNPSRQTWTAPHRLDRQSRQQVMKAKVAISAMNAEWRRGEYETTEDQLRMKDWGDELRAKPSSSVLSLSRRWRGSALAPEPVVPWLRRAVAEMPGRRLARCQ